MAIINGNQTSETLQGTNDNDTITGLGGNDTLNGGAGDDLLIGEAGNDSISGGDGIDTVRFNGISSGYQFITRESKLYVTDIDNGDGDEGTDTVNILDVENLFFLGDQKTVKIVNVTGSNLFNGTSSSDLLQGYTGNDWLIGNEGNDTLSGSEGVDTAIFNAALSGYKLLAISGKLTIEDFETSNGNEGSDIVNGDIENLRFNPNGISTNLSITQESIVNSLTEGNQATTSIQAYSGGFINYWLGADGFYFRAFKDDGTSSSIETKVLDVETDKVSDDVTVATFSDGSFVLAWTGEDASSTGLYVQRFDVTGKAISPKFRANDTITDSQNKPAIGILSDGSYVVAWQSANQGDSIKNGVAFGDTPNQTGIFAQLFDKNSQAIGGELKISESGGGNPFVTNLSDGKFIVGYEAITTGIDRMTIYANLYNQQGNIITTLHDLSVPYTDLVDGSAYDPYNAVDDKAIANLSSSADPDQINYSLEPTDKPNPIKDASGRDITNELRQSSKNPVATALEGGKTLIAWHAPVDPYLIPSDDPTVDYDRSIMLRLYDNLTGQALTQELKANSFTQYDQTQPAIAALKGGGFVVVWQSLLKDNSYLGIYGQRFDSNGLKIGAEFQINTKVADSQKEPSVTGLSDGGFVVSWVAEYQEGNQQGKYQNGLSGTEIVQQRFDKDGNKLGLSLAGGADNDTITLGGTDSIQLDGAAGNDELVSGDGIDTLRGGDGDDTLDGGKGNDFLFGGADDDRFVAGEGSDWIDGGSGSDTLLLLGSKTDYEIKKISDRYTIRNLTSGFEGNDSTDTLVNIELLEFTLKTDPNDDGLLSLASFGSTSGNNVPGIEVTDDDINNDTTLNGTDKDDTLTGGNVTGRADLLMGGDGDDLYVALGNNLVIYDTSGTDTLQLASASVDLSLPQSSINKIRGLQSIENVVLTGNKALNLTGNATDNRLFGNDGANIIKGGAGSDILSGGSGKDKLTGGDGNDIFLFQSSLSKKEIDIITDFVSGTDKIRLSSAIFKGLDEDKDGQINFISGSGLKSSEVFSVSFIIYDSKTGKLYYDRADDDTGTYPSVLFAQLSAPSSSNGGNPNSGGNTNSGANSNNGQFGSTTGSQTSSPSGFGSNTNTSTTTSTEVTTIGVKTFPELIASDFDLFI